MPKITDTKNRNVKKRAGEHEDGTEEETSGIRSRGRIR